MGPNQWELFYQLIMEERQMADEKTVGNPAGASLAGFAITTALLLLYFGIRNKSGVTGGFTNGASVSFRADPAC
ncbi:hypothetical protein DGMP_29360 [Desulfomarina profundi]|uniref:Uncharacterized protein n=1 Tax=Desulfomarina profundi TaxID=2772557 RepID=A0A8D5FN91_9BACT|nr:hypothetical protein DGMP_29360 [Desulfomarina profundi]